MLKWKRRYLLSLLLITSMVIGGRGTTVYAENAIQTDVIESQSLEDNAIYLEKAGMMAEASSSGGSAYTADKAIDGNNSTIWHGRWEGDDIPPHWIAVQLDKENSEVKQVKEITLTSRSDVHSGHESINNVQCTIWVSENGTDYTEAVTNAKINNGGGVKTTIVVNRKASYIKITGSSNFMSIAEIDVAVYTDDVDLDAKLALEEKIKAAKQLIEEADIGSGFNQYPQTAADAMREVISAAEEAMTGNDKEVSKAASDLEQAMKEFQDAKRIFQKKDLEDLIGEAESLYNRTEAGEKPGNCSKEAKDVFAKAIEKARKSMNGEDSEKMFSSYGELKKAIAVFISSIIVEDEKDSIDISGTWQFEMAAKEDAGNLSETVKLPGSMDENGKGNDNTDNISPTYLNRDYTYSGEATYQREIEIPKDWDGKNITLFLERTRKTRVWVDDTQVGEGQQKSYTAPHTYDLTDYVEAGKTHTLTIEVDNSPKGMPEAMYTTFEKDFPWGHMVSEHTQTNWNGILGEMKLEAAPAVHVESFKIRPDVDKNIALVKLKVSRDTTEGAVSGSVELRAESYNNEAESHTPDVQNFDFQIPDGENTAEIELEYEMGEGVLLWDEFSPTFYNITAVLRTSEEDGLVHSCVEEESFGMRKFEALYVGDGGKQFAVNGRPTQLRGEINCAVFPMTGYAPMDLESWLEVMQTYKDYGLNHVRFHTWIPPKAAFEAADLLGLYIQYELPQWGHKMFGDVDKGDTSAADYYYEESVKVFDWFLNSPSAVMMALGNELRPGFYYYDVFLGRLNELEPQLLYTDIAGWSAYTSNVEFANSVPTRGANYLHRVEPSTNWDHWDNTNKTPVPFLAHEPGQLQVYPDYEEEIAKYYEKNSLLKPRNLEYFQDILENAGMGDMDQKFNQSSGELSAMLYRYMTEGYMRTPGAGGFQLLGLQDFSGQGTALVGMLDAFLESKGDITPEEFRQSCSELTILSKLSKFVWENNETFTADIVIPNYSAADVNTSVKWILETEAGEEVASGTLGAADAKQGKVTAAGTIEADLSGVTKAECLKLRLEMEQMPGKDVAPYAVGTNEYSIWVYPADVSEETPEEISVYTQFTNQAKKDLEDGKNVLIVSEGSKEALPKSKAVTFRPDFWSPMFHSADNDGYVLGCYIDEEHPVFADFPTETFANWQWYELINNSRSILLDGAPSNLKPVVQAIPTIDLGDRLGTLFEAKVGNGKLMVSSIDLLNNESAAAKQLLYSIKNYMTSDKFNPTAELDAEYVRELLPANDIKGITADINTEMEIGESQNISVACINYKGSKMEFPEDAVLTYHAEDEKVASVSEDGTITAVGAGMTKIQVQMTSGGITYETNVVVVVGALTAEEISNEEFEIKVSSADPSYPAKNMIDGNDSTFWHSDYSNPDEEMPQEVELLFKNPTEVSGIVCTARKDNIGGAVLKASIAVKKVGADDYETVVAHKEFTSNDKEIAFAFPQMEVEGVKIIIEDAVMDSSSTNAAAIAELKLYKGNVITQVEEIPEIKVRFGTELEKILSKNPLPETVKITVNEDQEIQVPVIWNTSVYNPNIAGEYVIEGTFFCEEAINMENRKAEYRITVCQKDLTTPADKTQFDKVLTDAGTYQEKDYTSESWEQFNAVYQQAKSFGALTNATQHDTDVMTEKLQEAIAGLIPAEKEIAVSGVKLNKTEVTLKIDSAIKLEAAVEPEDAMNQNVVWTSSNEEAATVNQMGLVIAKEAGETIITVTTEDGGFRAECKVIVVGDEPDNPDNPDSPNTPNKPGTPDKPNTSDNSVKTKTQKSNIVKTGDDGVQRSIGWMALLFVSMGCILSIRITRRKWNK